MRFYFKDYDGHDVLTPSFMQYDAGQEIYVTDVPYDVNTYDSSPTFHFWNRDSDAVLYRSAQLVAGSGVLGSAEAIYSTRLPNVMMAAGLPFFAALYLSNSSDDRPACTVGVVRITVQTRPTPGFGLEYSDGTQISASQIYSVLGGGDDNNAIRDATNQKYSTYFEAFNGYLKDTQDAYVDAAAAKGAAEAALEATLAAKDATAQAAKDAITTDVLDGYHICVSTTAPVEGGAVSTDQKIITFVIDE